MSYLGRLFFFLYHASWVYLYAAILGAAFSFYILLFTSAYFLSFILKKDENKYIHTYFSFFLSVFLAGSAKILTWGLIAQSSYMLSLIYCKTDEDFMISFPFCLALLQFLLSCSWYYQKVTAQWKHVAGSKLVRKQPHVWRIHLS